MRCRECSLSDLEPKLKESLERLVPTSERVVICCQCTESLQWRAYMLTDRRAVAVLLDQATRISRVDEHTSACLLEDVTAIRESDARLFLGFGYHNIFLHGHSHEVAVAFIFGLRDTILYQRFSSLLHKAVENARPSAGHPAIDTAERLRQLSKLHGDGLVTDEEFRTKRAQLLSEL